MRKRIIDRIFADPFSWGATDGGGNSPGGGSGGSGGGSTPSASWDDVTFIDYDGTVLYSYTTAEAQALTELPPLPEHEGLICQGWNYDLETIKEYDRPVTVGAMYITDDGKTRIYITLHEGRTSPMLGVCPNGTVTVDWGDGTEPDVLTGTSTSTVKWTPNHEYAAPGDYMISLTVDGALGLAGATSSNQYSYLLRYATGSDTRNRVYQNAIQKVELGNGVTSIGSHAFNNCCSLSSITIPEGVTSIGSNAFYYCLSLSSITIPYGVMLIRSASFQYCSFLMNIAVPNSVTYVESYAFNNCFALFGITLPDGVTGIGNNAFNGCRILSNITVPEGVTAIDNYAISNNPSLSHITLPIGVKTIGVNAFYGCSSLSSVVLPNSIETIASNAFAGCSGVKLYDFTNHIAVPTLANTNAFSSIPDDGEIRVPAALYDEWIAATNWSEYASQIVVKS